MLKSRPPPRRTGGSPSPPLPPFLPKSSFRRRLKFFQSSSRSGGPPAFLFPPPWLPHFGSFQAIWRGFHIALRKFGILGCKYSGFMLLITGKFREGLSEQFDSRAGLCGKPNGGDLTILIPRHLRLGIGEIDLVHDTELRHLFRANFLQHLVDLFHLPL